MHISNLELFKNWLTKALESLCDADPSALAKYIIALLQKNKSAECLKLLCMEELVVFLKEDTNFFINKMFEVLDNKAYMNQPNEVESKEESPKSRQDDSNQITSDTNKESPLKDLKCDKEFISQEDQDKNEKKQTEKQPTLSKESGFKQYVSKHPTKVCFEFQAKGVCSRGGKCRYQHVPKVMQSAEQALSNLFSLASANMLPLLPPPNILATLENNELFKKLLDQNKNTMDFPLFHKSATSSVNDPVSIKRKNEDLFNQGNSKKPNLVSISKNSGHLSKSILLSKVPYKCLDVNSVNEYFSQFGKIVNVLLSPNDIPSSILVEFSSPREARMAHDCPDAVFGNRFVKISYFNICKVNHTLNETSNKVEFPKQSDLIYINPEYQARKQEAKQELLTKQAEEEERDRKILKDLSEQVQSILNKLRDDTLDDNEKVVLRSELKEALTKKDSITFKKDAHGRFVDKKEVKVSYDKYHCDLRSSVICAHLNKFSNPTDILNHFSKYGKISFSKLQNDTQLVIGYATHKIATLAFKEASTYLNNRIDKMEWMPHDYADRFDNVTIPSLTKTTSVK